MGWLLLGLLTSTATITACQIKVLLKTKAQTGKILVRIGTCLMGRPLMPRMASQAMPTLSHELSPKKNLLSTPSYRLPRCSRAVTIPNIPRRPRRKPANSLVSEDHVRCRVASDQLQGEKPHPCRGLRN